LYFPEVASSSGEGGGMLVHQLGMPFLPISQEVSGSQVEADFG
jgi:hypothetical protein